MEMAPARPLEGEGRDARQEAFVEVLRPLLPRAHRLAYGLLRDAHEAEDAVQEAIFKAWRAFAHLRPQSSVQAWFLTIVINQCRQQQRNRWWSGTQKGGDAGPGERGSCLDVGRRRRSAACDASVRGPPWSSRAAL
jgi:RNA polymerase sigma factor (sigma-70 family)